MFSARLITWRPEPCPGVPTTCNIFNRECLPSPLTLEGPLARWGIVGCNVTSGRTVTPFFWPILLLRPVITAACTHRTLQSRIDKIAPCGCRPNAPDAPHLSGEL